MEIKNEEIKHSFISRCHELNTENPKEIYQKSLGTNEYSKITKSRESTTIASGESQEPGSVHK